MAPAPRRPRAGAALAFLSAGAALLFLSASGPDAYADAEGGVLIPWWGAGPPPGAAWAGAAPRRARALLREAPLPADPRRPLTTIRTDGPEFLQQRPVGAAAAAALDAALGPAGGGAAARLRGALFGAAELEPAHWLYTVIAADHAGAPVLLEHWLNHYLDTLRFDPGRVLAVVHTAEAAPRRPAAAAAAAAALAARGVRHVAWAGPFSADAALGVQLAVLARHVDPARDWVTVADADEFLQFPGGRDAPALIAAAAAAGATHVRAALVDRVAAGGALPALAPPPAPLGVQFPLRCAVVGGLAGGAAAKVAAFRGALRVTAGNHEVVSAGRADAYFGPAPPGARAPRGGRVYAEDLRVLTPYCGGGGRRPAVAALRPFAEAAESLHFKWRAGVVEAVADRLAWLRGDAAREGAGGSGPLPRFSRHRELSALLAALAEGRLDLAAAGCEPAEPPLAAA
jgi:hypothetical protein